MAIDFSSAPTIFSSKEAAIRFAIQAPKGAASKPPASRPTGSAIRTRNGAASVTASASRSAVRR